MIAPGQVVDCAAANQLPAFALYARADVLEPLGSRGLTYALVYDSTGACTTADFYQSRYTYPLFVMGTTAHSGPINGPATYAQLMQEVRQGFDRTLSRLPLVFGVSRRTLYNWLEGETPREAHRAKLVQLAAAAREFLAAGFTPTADALDWTLMRDKSFLELLAEGEPGALLAQKFMRVVAHERTAQARLERSLEGAPDIESDILEDGTRAYRESL